MDNDRKLELALHRIQNGQIDGAIELLRQLLGDDPDLAQAHALLAICLMSKKRLSAAEHEAKLALMLDPGQELPLFAVANIKLAQRKFKEANEHIDQLLEMDPNHAPYYILKANLKGITFKHSEILPLLEKALELAPESPDVLSELSDYYAECGEVDLAESYAREALQYDPEHSSGLVAMGKVLLEKNEIELAREHAIMALQNDPSEPQALGLMAGIKARKSLLLGLWWRYNVWMNRIGPTRSILVLLFAYIVYRVLSMGFDDMGHREAADFVRYVWLGLVIYSFLGPTIFNNQIKKELDDVKLRSDF
jgi:tetratricopeptide (TPR) repeat protein